jgi:two-component system, NarL family, nitrate/nitrite response regulator NarL
MIDVIEKTANAAQAFRNPMPRPVAAVRVLAVIDAVLYRYGIASALREMFGEVSLVEMPRLEQALALLAQDRGFSVVLYQQPGANGAQGMTGLDALVQAAGGIPVVTIAATERREDILDVMGRGARGYISGASSMTVLSHALGLVLSGELYVPSSAFRPAAGQRPARRGADHRSTRPAGPTRPLTPRQTEIIGLLALGKRNKEIARDLGLLEGTVKIHVKAILRSLSVSNRTEAVMAAARAGYLPKDIGDALAPMAMPAGGDLARRGHE